MNARINSPINPHEDYFTVRLDEFETITVSRDEIVLLNKSREAQGLAALQKIKRSSGQTEYVSESTLRVLQRNRARRKNQQALSEMRQPVPRRNSLVDLVKRLFNH